MSAVDWIPLERDTVQAGDQVSADAGGMPIYRVVAVEDGQALVEGDGRAPTPLPISRFHWKARTAVGGDAKMLPLFGGAGREAD